jgi:hypothetical protein
MKKFILTLIVCLLLTHAAILGAFLAGAVPSAWTFGLAWGFSLALALADALVGRS